MPELNIPQGLKRRDFVVTSSTLDRLEACPGAGVFDVVEREKPGFPQWHGIFIHRFLEYVVTKGHDAALTWIRTKKMKATVACCEHIDVDALPTGVPELALGHNPIDDTARELPDSRSLTTIMDVNTEQYGRADLVSDAQDRVSFDGETKPLITDWKSNLVVKHAHPDRSTQLLGLAASLRAIHGYPAIDVALAGVWRTGEIDWAISTLTAAQIDPYVERARRVQLRVIDDRERADRGISPEFIRSEAGCQWCNCQPFCPAWVR